MTRDMFCGLGDDGHERSGFTSPQNISLVMRGQTSPVHKTSLVMRGQTSPVHRTSRDMFCELEMTGLS
jgi:hypothetical protein